MPSPCLLKRKATPRRARFRVLTDPTILFFTDLVRCFGGHGGEFEPTVRLRRCEPLPSETVRNERVEVGVERRERRSVRDGDGSEVGVVDRIAERSW